VEIDPKSFLAHLGGRAAADSLTHEARADAIEHFLEANVAAPRPTGDTSLPTVAQLEAEIETRTYRRGVGKLFAGPERVSRLPPMPAAPTLLDFFAHRFQPAHHLLQSANLALQQGLPEEVILASLLHDSGQALVRAEHGFWGAQLYEPYVPPRTRFAIRYHQVLRFYPDEHVGYNYPDVYYRLFGVDYVPPPEVERLYKRVRRHRWYMDARLVTVNDLYAFAPDVTVSIDPFIDIIGRHFRQPPEGLGNDNSPVAHMWRAMAHPDAPL
jgi:hypothetical protein